MEVISQHVLYILCVEPFGHGGDLSACTVRTVC